MRHLFSMRRLGLILIVTCYVLLAGSTLVGQHGLLHLWTLRQHQYTFEAQAFALLRENEELRQDIMRLHSDERFLEKVAREKLGLVKKGELVYRFGSSKKASQQ
jgi:cell division protein FtsB